MLEAYLMNDWKNEYLFKHLSQFQIVFNMINGFDFWKSVFQLVQSHSFITYVGALNHALPYSHMLCNMPGIHRIRMFIQQSSLPFSLEQNWDEQRINAHEHCFSEVKSLFCAQYVYGWLCHKQTVQPKFR